MRTDMNDVVATGHIMRCLAIADAARNLGEETIFLTADDCPAKLLKQRGYAYHVLGTRWDDMESELPALLEMVHKKKIKKLLIDSYYVTETYLAALGAYVEIYYLDDLNAFRYPVSSIICYANYWKQFCYEKCYKGVKLYLGAQYVPLREAFRLCGKKRMKARVENLLILSGGTDRYHAINGILAQINRQRYEKIEVVCGGYYPRYSELCAKYAKEENVAIYSSVSDIENHMKAADLAISASGTTLYELCACGTPTISYVLADNQIHNATSFQADKIIDYAGDIRTDDVPQNICNMLDRYEYNVALRAERSAKMQALIDGEGAERLAEILREV